jgi:crotonobetainyl-CoA:carnitine CoA-transferase CaiB-like acyl-CoA transferase
MPRDLEGLLVVTLEQAVAAPYASCKLADAGARVIKLERAEGDFARRYDKAVKGLSAYFVWLNRGKESVRFNLKDSADLAMLKRMLAEADVFIQNLAPGAAARAGAGSAEMRDMNPRLITCDISGYGQSGPYRDMKAYDLLVQAESGLANVTGTPETPGRVGVSVCDIACGMYAHQAILQALYARERNGRGRGIQVSLYHAMADWMNVPYLQNHYGGTGPPRPGLHHPTIAPYGNYACRDGRGVLFSIQNEREWQRLCRDVLARPEVADDPRFATNPDRVAHRAVLDSIIQEVFDTLTRDEVLGRLEAAQIAYGRLSTMDDLERHPQNTFIRVESSAGDIQMLAPPPIVPGEAEHYGAVPELGEHDDAVRAQFAASDPHTGP